MFHSRWTPSVVKLRAGRPVELGVGGVRQRSRMYSRPVSKKSMLMSAVERLTPGKAEAT